MNLLNTGPYCLLVLMNNILTIVLLFAAVNNAQSQDAARITLAPQSAKVMEGGVVSFFCKASGNPAPEIYWAKSGKRISSSKYAANRYLVVDMPHGSVLRIEPVRARRDDNSFECVASNSIGQPATAEATLEVYPEGQVPSGYPRIKESPSLKAVEKDRNAVLLCSAEGNPDPEIIWLKDYIPVDLSDVRLKLLPTGSLQIMHSQESDEGKYECVASNSAGVSYSYGANLYVRVRRVPPHFSIPPENAEVMPGGDVNITCVAVGSPMPFVKWRLGAVELTPEDNVPVGKNVLMLVDIQESANYTCVAASDLGNIEAVAVIKVKALPKPPTNLVISEITPTSVKLSWTSGNIDPISSYIIQYKNKYGPAGEPHNEISDITHTEYTILGLSAHTTYEFRLVALNNIGRGIPSGPIDGTTGELAPGTAPTNVKARPVSSSTVVVQWDEPEIPNGVIRGYQVYYTLKPELSINLWTLHQVDDSHLTTISNLMTNKTYAIRVLAFTSAGEGKLSEPIFVKTTQGVPDQPTNLQGFSISADSIQLNWEAPESSDAVQSYELYYNDSFKKQNVRVTIAPPKESYLLIDLVPNTVYHMRVAARSKRGEGPSTPTIQVRTLEYVPGAAPQNIQTEAIDSESIQVSWDPPPIEKQHGNIEGYKVFYTEDASKKDMLEAMNININDPSQRTQVLEGLDKFTAYKIWVLSYTRIGDGPASDVMVEKTDEDVPGEPRKLKVEAINSTAIQVSWKPPDQDQQNGIIRGYQIHYNRVNDRDEVIGSAGADLIDISKEEAIITGLFPDTTYSFQVAAYTKKGDGERSRPKKAKTKGAVPSVPRGFDVRLVQEDPPVVTVSWQQPLNKHGDLTDYRLRYGIKDSRESDVDEHQFNSETYRWTSGFLDEGQTYEFRISAKNNVDFGEEAIKTIKTPDGIPSGAPQNLSIVGLSASSVRLRWDPPDPIHRNGDIVMYEILYYEREKETNVFDANTTARTVDIEGLESDSAYMFQIKGYTSRGAGPWSAKLPFKTYGQLPPPPNNVRLTRLSQTSLQVTWDPPEFPDIIGYRIYYNTRVQGDPEKWRSDEIVGAAREHVIGGLEPHSVYVIRVRAKLADNRYGNFSALVVSNRLQEAPTHIEAPTVIRKLSDTSVELQLRKASEVDGKISYYLLIIVTEKLAETINPEDIKPNDLTKPDEGRWIAARFEGIKLPRIYELGNPNFMPELTTSEHHNEPLTKGTTYQVFMRAYTAKHEYTSSLFSKPFSTTDTELPINGEEPRRVHKPNDTALLKIVAPICGAIVFILVVILFVIFIRYRRRRPVMKKTHLPEPAKQMLLPPHPEAPSQPSDPVELRRINFLTPALLSHQPIPVTDLAEHIDALKSSEGLKFSQEYESIEPGQQFTWDNSNLEVNKPKNRYANVIAYDHSRVILQNVDGVQGSDYINANYMDGYRKQNAYIATQGPLPETAGDFWRMIWEQRTATIVMMTKLEERTRIKCDQYWPNRNTETYDMMHVTLVDVMELATYTIRTFQLTRDCSPKKKKVPTATLR